MNIKEILKENGYEIVGNLNMKYFRLKFTKEEIDRKIEEIEERGPDFYDYDIYGQFNVKISEIGFNGYGNLYIVFTCIDDEHFEVGDTFEVIEYESGEEDDIGADL